MAGSRQVTFCVLLLGVSICCSIYPQGKQHMKELKTRTRTTLGDSLVSLGTEETPGRGRVEREVTDCPVLETRSGKSVQKIVDVEGKQTFNFFIQPQLGFKSLVFHARVKNKIPLLKYPRKSLVVTSSQMDIDWAHPSWIPVRIEYFRTAVSFGPDRHALRVKVGKNVNRELITHWWRTHRYEGFTVESEGPLRALLGCNPWRARAETVVDKGRITHTLLVACILGGCFLLVVATATIFLIARHSRSQNGPPTVPTSLLQGRSCRRDDDNSNIYDSIDESTLAKLRQHFDSNSLAVGRTEHAEDNPGCSAENHYEYMKCDLDSTGRAIYHTPGIPSWDVRDMRATSLMEEKEAVRECLGLDSPVENHYVEMHGIVSRTSSLSK